MYNLNIKVHLAGKTKESDSEVTNEDEDEEEEKMVITLFVVFSFMVISLKSLNFRLQCVNLLNGILNMNIYLLQI